MTWTREPPKVPGWYWARRPGDTDAGDMQVVRVWRESGQLRTELGDDMARYFLVGTEWYGPLEPPP